MAGKELGGRHRPYALQNFNQGCTGGIFQQPHFRGRGLREHFIRQDTASLQIQVSRGVWRPAPGESKGKKGKSFKTVSLCGKLGTRLYVIKTFLAQALNAEFIDWYVRMLDFVGGKTNVYCYMENNKLQDPFFQQVFKPLVAKVRREQKIALFIRGDEEKKTDKATRIEANLERSTAKGTSSSTRLNGTTRT